MRDVRNIVVVQTAFIGDVILTLPLVQACKRRYPDAMVDIVVIPAAKGLCSNHPDIREVISFDKRGADDGIGGLLRIARKLRSRSYDLALIPHRSLRSAIIAFLAHIPMRIGFNRSAGRFLLTSTVRYEHAHHEIDRNLALLRRTAGDSIERVLPRLHPSEDDKKRVDRLLVELEVVRPETLIAIAPGTVWKTKRWLKERFSSLAVNFDEEGFEVVLIGGQEDRELCEEIRTLSGSSHVYATAGMLSLLQSAELIRRCRMIVCNDSAPMHLAAAVGTPVVAIFGATVPSFGFGPSGPRDVVVERDGLKCRPCSIHGGEKCPIKTFDCMNDISYDRVFRIAMELLTKTPTGGIRH